ncbi:MAG: hypothetical protein VXZ84_04020 [Planctomycetota bacterium]|nr:hypothetical protein [Planctomycetota bacterium]
MDRSIKPISQPERPLGHYLAFATCIALLLLLCPMPEMNRMFRYGMDLLHAPFFAILSLFLDQKRRKGKQNGFIQGLCFWVFLCMLGAALEAIQTIAGRDTNWHDGLSNLLGITAGLLFSYALSATDRIYLKYFGGFAGTLMLLLGSIYGLYGVWDTVQAEIEFPLIADFETHRELLRWEARDAVLIRSKQHARSGHFSGNITFQEGRYPGVSIELPPGDWSTYRYLTLDIMRAENKNFPQSNREQSANLALRIKLEDDGPSDSFQDRFESTVALQPGQNQIRIPVDVIANSPAARSLRLNRMKRLSLFVTNLKSSQVLFIDKIHLE